MPDGRRKPPLPIVARPHDRRVLPATEETTVSSSPETTAMRPRPLPPSPDTSAGYLHNDQPPTFCPAATTFAPDLVFRCVLAVGHSGSHRNGGMHWKEEA